jgi:hypothetical protein
MPASANKRLIGIRPVCARYNDVTPRTVTRWQNDPRRKFPQPVTINCRRYWDVSDLDQYDRDLTREALRKPRRTQPQPPFRSTTTTTT